MTHISEKDANAKLKELDEILKQSIESEHVTIKSMQDTVLVIDDIINSARSTTRKMKQIKEGIGLLKEMSQYWVSAKTAILKATMEKQVMQKAKENKIKKNIDDNKIVIDETKEAGVTNEV